MKGIAAIGLFAVLLGLLIGLPFLFAISLWLGLADLAVLACLAFFDFRGFSEHPMGPYI